MKPTILIPMLCLMLGGCATGKITYESDIARLADSAANQSAAVARGASVTASLVKLEAVPPDSGQQIEQGLTAYNSELHAAHAALLVGDTVTAEVHLTAYSLAATQIAALGAGDWLQLIELLNAEAGTTTVVATPRISPGEVALYAQMAMAAYQAISQAVEAHQRAGLVTDAAALEALNTNAAAAEKGLALLRAVVGGEQ